MRRSVLRIIAASLLFILPAAAAIGAEKSGREPESTLEARLRSRLLRNGFGLPDEFDLHYSRQTTGSITFRKDSYRPDAKQSTLQITGTLAAFAPFPPLRAALERGLFESGLSPEIRLARFYGQAYILGSASGILYSGKTPDHSYELNVRHLLERWDKDDSYDGKKLRTNLPAKKAVAQEYLLTLLRVMEEAAPSASLNETGLKNAPWHIDLGDGHDSRVTYTVWPFLGAADRGARVLFEKYEDAAFLKKARAVLASSNDDAPVRLDALEGLAAAPDISPADAIRRAPYRSDLAAMDKAWAGTLSGGFWFTPSEPAYAKLEKGLLEAVLAGRLHAVSRNDNAGRKLPDASSAPRITLTRLGLVPTAFTSDAPLYMLFPKTRDAGGNVYGFNKRLAEEGISVFSSSVLAALDGPVLLPLNPSRQGDAKILSWYASGGSALGRALLMASPEKPELLARRMFSWHFLAGRHSDSTGKGEQAARPDTPAAPDGNRRLLMAHPVEGDVLLALLPHLEGEAATLFLRRGERLWFAVPGEEGAVWHLAEGPLEPGPLSGGARLPDKTGQQGGKNSLLPGGAAFLDLDPALTESLLAGARNRAAPLLAWNLAANYFAGDKNPAEALDFLHRHAPRIREAMLLTNCAEYDAATALKELWRLSGNDSDWQWRWLKGDRESDRNECRRNIDGMRRDQQYKELFQL